MNATAAMCLLCGKGFFTFHSTKGVFKKKYNNHITNYHWYGKYITNKCNKESFMNYQWLILEYILWFTTTAAVISLLYFCFAFFLQFSRCSSLNQTSGVGGTATLGTAGRFTFCSVVQLFHIITISW